MIITTDKPYTKEEIKKHTKLAIESLSMDLWRVSLGHHRGSSGMTKAFTEEALKRCSEIDSSAVRPGFARMLEEIPRVLSGSDSGRIAEDALMYSIRCKNYARKFFP